MSIITYIIFLDMILIWILWITAQYLTYLVGGLNPSEKYESQLGLLFQYMEK
jgi:hypothetical protein